VREQPQLRRISLAVMVDGTAVRGPDGTLTYAERTPDELARIATLVRGAIGFNEQRGDRVDVVNMRFVAEADAPEAAMPGSWMRLERSEILRLAETGVLAIAALLVLLFVLRPMVLRLTMAPQPALAAALAGPGGPSSGSPGSPAALGAPGQEDMMQIANVEGAMRVAPIRRVSELVDSHPEESLAMLRNWITPEDS